MAYVDLHPSFEGGVQTLHITRLMMLNVPRHAVGAYDLLATVRHHARDILHCYQHLLDNARISITQCCLSRQIVSCPEGTQGTSLQLLSLSVVVRLSFDVARFCLSNSVVARARARHLLPSLAHFLWSFSCTNWLFIFLQVLSFPVVVHVIHGRLYSNSLSVDPPFVRCWSSLSLVRLLAQSLRCSLSMVVHCCSCSWVARCQWRSSDRTIDPGVRLPDSSTFVMRSHLASF